MSPTNHLKMLTRYKAWANGVVLSMLTRLPAEEVTKPRTTRFGNIIHTLNHTYVIDHVFQAHLLGEQHSYVSRNTETWPPLDKLAAKIRQLDQWYISYCLQMSDRTVEEIVNFEFIGGGLGAMSRGEIILHVVNHNTYHRGFMGDMMYQAGVTPDATDLPVFLREVSRTQ